MMLQRTVVWGLAGWMGEPTSPLAGSRPTTAPGSRPTTAPDYAPAYAFYGPPASRLAAAPARATISTSSATSIRRSCMRTRPSQIVVWTAAPWAA